MRAAIPALLFCLLSSPLARAHEPHASATDRFRTSRTDTKELDLPEERDRFTFAVFGDRTGGPAAGIRVLEQAITEVNLLAPDLVMTVGDLIQGYGGNESWIREMREYHDTMNRLTAPWFPVAGNHDVYWRGPGRPPNEHEGNYERHFGPLWYAFRHRDCWFVVLYTDEGDPRTGAKGFQQPARQRMSPAQLAFLEETLETARSARHVFVFLHHPRWIGGGYGDDWDKVHRMLVDAGNVTAVFAGHIHRMRYDARDGIEYFTLATVGGAQTGVVPEAGYLHQYMYVTVDDEAIAAASFPVGSADDPREITGDVGGETRQLARALAPRLKARVALDRDLAAEGDVEFALSNPTSRKVELSVTLESADGRWRAEPDHEHVVLEPGATREFRHRIAHPPGPVDRAWALPRVVVAADYLGPSRRFSLPARSTVIPVRAATLPAPAEGDGVLVLDGVDDHLFVDRASARATNRGFTVELWFRADELSGRRTLVTTRQANAFWLGLKRGDVEFAVGGGGERVTLEAEDRVEAGHWHHVAAVCGGKTIALYLDGKRIDRREIGRCAIPGRSPLLIGAGHGRVGQAREPFAGAVDDVRVTLAPRYTADRFSPERRAADDGATVLLLHMDADVGPWVFDASPARDHAAREAGAHVEIEPRRQRRDR